MVTFKKRENLVFKQNLLLSISFNEYFENDWPGNKLLKSYRELEQILDFDDSNTLRFIYFNRAAIENILLEEDIILSLDRSKLALESLHNLFYLDLLLINNNEIINYKCSFNFIEKLNSFIKNNNSDSLIQNIIFMKTNLDLIKSYKQIDVEEKENDVEEEENELKEMEKQGQIKKMINDKLKKLNIEIKEDYIISQNIDKIYIEIIISWIKKENFEEFDPTIINQLFIEHIYLTKNMFDKFADFLENETNIKKYMIKNINDLSDNKKINFHYILLKYILKKPLFIYKFNFLCETRNIILNAIKYNLNELLSLKNQKNDINIQERIEYIISQLIDSEYYQINNIKLSKENSSKRGMNSEYSTKMNSNNKNSKENNKSLNVSNEEASNTLLKSYQSKSKQLSKESNNNNVSNENKNISIGKKEIEEAKEKIKEEINEEEEEEEEEGKKEKEEENNKLHELKNKSSEDEILGFIKIIKPKEQPKEVTIANRTKNKFHDQSQFIKKLNNNYYITGGKEELFLYDSLYRYITKIELDENVTTYYYIYEINCNSNQIKIAILCKSIYYVVTINLNNLEKIEYNNYKSEDLALQSIFSITGENYIITGNKGIYNITTDFNSEIRNKSSRNNSPFIAGIKIDKDIIALTSNSIIPFGEDKLILYNKSTNGIKEEIKGHSFRISSNGLSLIENENDDKRPKILLCACKKYRKNQKNGILLVNLPKLNKKDKTNKLFYETGPFEVDCFCPITIVENKNLKSSKITKKKNITIKNTDFFFVGGFDEDKREGMIKLYKINYNDNEIYIEFIQDIINNDTNNSSNNNNTFEGFDRSITSIIQSNILGNILVTSLDGNVYLFKPPNIDYFLSNNYL
mgnify:CR=1 FL=1